MPRKYADLAFAQAMIKAAMDEIKGQVIKQVQSGNVQNEIGVKLVVATGRTSFDFSKEPTYQKAKERLDKAKAHEATVKERLAAAGKGKIKQGAPSLRATVS